MTAMAVDASTYLNGLLGNVLPEEWTLLEMQECPLVISEHNRTTLLEMRDVMASCAEQTRLAQIAVDPDEASTLADELQAYLDEQMPETPQAHKWIVLASLYLTFVARRPMHAVSRVGARVRECDGETIYECPVKVPGDNPICDACVCRPI